MAIHAGGSTSVPAAEGKKRWADEVRDAIGVEGTKRATSTAKAGASRQGEPKATGSAPDAGKGGANAARGSNERN
jgi:hypothetical protein